MKTKNTVIVNKSLQKIRRVFGGSMVVLCLLGLQSCEDSFLDVVPDNVRTLDDSFKLRSQAEKYLFTCYAYIPKNGDGVYNIGMLAGDETWVSNRAAISSDAYNIATGIQRKAEPYMNAWDGRYQAAGPSDLYPIFNGIRHCNIFLTNLEDRTKVRDILESERLRWIAEVKFLKAYYHYYLMRMYGPIPVIRVNLPIDAPEEQMQVPREPIDESVDYLVSLLDEAAVGLPVQISSTQDELGRITRPIALGIKAELLLMAASPLFNGNTDMVGFNTKEGKPFFNPAYDANKWKRAADAAKEAIDAALAGGNKIFTKKDVGFTISQTTKTKLDITQAVTEPWNTEIIWANPNSRTFELQRLCMMPLVSGGSTNVGSNTRARKILSPTLKSAMNFYTKNGVPIEEDKTLTFDITQLKVATAADKLDIKEGYRTSMINFNREPRFYADLGFDGAIFYKFDSGSDETKFHIKAKYQDNAGSSDVFDFNITGYYIKKLINWEQKFTGGTEYKQYAWPELRLADLYLMYAEALNEVDGRSTAEVLQYVDAIRTRAGLSGVVDSWTNFSNNPTKYTTKEGLREIIHRERSIEMAFEGKNYWDIRRWKKATQRFNEPVKGWNVFGISEGDYYQIRTLYQQRFVSPRDYFWPIDETSLLKNTNLIQNPGW